MGMRRAKKVSPLSVLPDRSIILLTFTPFLVFQGVVYTWLSI